MNTLTDTLNLVTREDGRGTFHLFKRKRAEQYGFALVVFRKQALLGYIPSSDIAVESDIQRRYDRLGIKDGDIILSVNLGPQRITIAEALPTQDGWPRRYEMELDLFAHEPVQFAQRYMQQSDPAQWAKTAIEGFIQYTAGLWNHDDINETLLREWAFKALMVPQNTISGLRVVAIHKVRLAMNPDREREIQLERQRRLEEQQIHKDGYIQRVKKEEAQHLEQMSVQGQLDIERLRLEEQRRLQQDQAAFQREEDLKQQDHENIKAISDLDEQIKRQEKTFTLQTQSTRQQLELDTIQKQHEQDMNLLVVVEELKQQAKRHQLEKSQQEHLLAQQTQVWESNMRKQWYEKIGEGTMPGLIARIREQILDERSSLNRAVSEPELRYLLDILSGGNAGGTLPLLPMPQNTPEQPPKSQVSQVPEQQGTSPTQQPVTGQYRVLKVLPGVIQQGEETVEIPDLGIKLIQTTFSDDLRSKAGTETTTGFIVYMLSEYGPASQANLQVADIIVAINDQDLESVQAISQAVSTRENSNDMALYVLRGQELKEIIVKIAAK